MNGVCRMWVIGCLSLTILSAGPAESAGIGGALAKGASRSVGRSVRRAEGRTMARSVRKAIPNRSARAERLRDLKITPRPLRQARTVRRAVTGKQMRIEKRNGIAPNRHLASRPARGRIPTAEQYRKAYGIRHPVGYVETVRIPKRQPARLAKAWNGAPGRGELTSSKRIPPRQIVSVHRLRAGAAK